jgi:hypothetical protein
MVLAAAWWTVTAAVAAGEEPWIDVDAFDRPDSFYAGDGWESLNPGYWMVRDGALRRRVDDRGAAYTSWAPSYWFPWHWETQVGKPMPMEFDPSLPFGMIWRRDWKLTGNYAIAIEATVRGVRSGPVGKPDWRQNQPGYGLMGICFGGESLFESWRGGRPRWGKEPAWLESGHASWMAVWRDDGRFGLFDHATDAPRAAGKGSFAKAAMPKAGDRAVIEVRVSGAAGPTCTVTARLSVGGRETVARCEGVDRAKFAGGYFGLVGRGLLGFAVDRVRIEPGANEPIAAPINDLEICYALGDTLHEVKGWWHCRFVAKFRSDGKGVAIRVADSESPEGGWSSVPVAGAAPIVYDTFRCNTAVIDVTLPASPATTTLYYTVWKDGRDVTGDPREGLLGRKEYVGRLPRLCAPYRVLGFGGHSLYGPSELPDNAWFAANWVHGQATRDAYRHMEAYDAQVLLWDDDVWYLELLLAPPSAEDAYKTIMETIANPTSRWVMMRHWNILNPGDHDYGLDDAKGPEHLLVRQRDDLGYGSAYCRRNFRTIEYLMRGDEDPNPDTIPKHWRCWRMPNGDFSIVVLDGRSWRTSQYTDLWVREGWGHARNVYDRRDPTRTLLGEEQFAWLEQTLRTDPSPLILVSGLNALHTMWSGWLKDPETGLMFNQRDRVAADYAGWVKAGADRVLSLMGSRPGVVTVYGDVHLGSILEDRAERVYECSFGAIGRHGSRRVKEDWGPDMEDYDGRRVHVCALYHDKYRSPSLEPRTGHLNFCMLETEFAPGGVDPGFRLTLRDLVDAPEHAPRGGGRVLDRAANTGRPQTCRLPALETLPEADVLFSTADGRAIRGARSLADGRVPVRGLIDVAPGTDVVMTAFGAGQAEARIIRTLPLEENQ